MNDLDPRLRARCFVAMPFGRKGPAGSELRIEFDEIYAAVRSGVESSGVECRRADFSTQGGFVHKDMYEELALARYLVADLSLSNANVAYELGVRHGARTGPTLLIAAQIPGEALPFDFAPLRVAFYELDADGRLTPGGRRQLEESLEGYFESVRRGEWQEDNPLLQLSVHPRSERLQHEKADSFVARIGEASPFGPSILAALRRPAEEAVADLASIEEELHRPADDTYERISALLSVFLAYREKKAYERMRALAGRFRSPLAEATVVREQLALALNRIAEQAEAREAAALRSEAEALLEAIPEDERTSETFGIRGRIFKSSYNAAERAGAPELARGMLDRAIQAYEAGLVADPRDFFPGVNAVTLCALRLALAREGGETEQAERDEAWLELRVPVVRFAAERRAEPASDMERYWRHATLLELAAAGRDWKSARSERRHLLAIPAEDWMRTTTCGNLAILQRAFADDAEAQPALGDLIATLERK